MSNHFREVTKKDDTISRQVAIKVINYVRDICGMENLDDYRDILIECFKVMPSAQSERPKGEWLANGDIPKECPFCGEDWDKYVFGEVWYTNELPKFCPNCGADMRGEQNE